MPSILTNNLEGYCFKRCLYTIITIKQPIFTAQHESFFEKKFVQGGGGVEFCISIMGAVTLPCLSKVHLLTK